MRHGYGFDAETVENWRACVLAASCDALSGRGCRGTGRITTGPLPGVYTLEAASTLQAGL